MEKSSPALSQIFEPIRADLEQVDREFARHVESQVDLIPKIGRYIQTSGGKRIRPALLLMAARLAGYRGDRAVTVRGGRRVHPHRHAGPRRHHRRFGSAPRPPGGALAVGQRHHGAARRLPVHQVDGAGADARFARNHPAAVRRHAADDRRRAVPAHQERRRRHHRGRALRHHPPQDRVPVRRLRARSAACSAACRPHAGGGASRVRLQPRHDLPAGGRSAGLHRRRGSGGEAGRPATCARARSRCR